MKTTWGLEKISGWMRKKGRGRRSLLVALSVLLSLNIVFSAMPRAAFAESDDAVSSMTELLEAIEYSYGRDNVIRIDKSFEIYDTVVINYSKEITLSQTFGDAVITRAASFDGPLFELSDYASLTIGNGVIIDGNKSAAEAKAPMIVVDDTSALIVNGTLRNNNNTALASEGGAVYSLGSVTVDGGTVTGNEAYKGAGIYAAGGRFDISSGSIADNAAEYAGGGAYLSGCTDIAVSGTGSITENTAPIGAGVYLCNTPVRDSYYVISGDAVIYDNFTDMTSDFALPDTQCNVFMETYRDAPSFLNLTMNAKVGVYPMENNTVMPVYRLVNNEKVPGEINYFNQGMVVYDHDAEFLRSYTALDNGSIKLNVTASKVNIVDPNGYPVGCSVVSDMGQEVTGGTVLPGFPVHLVPQTAAGYTIPEGSFSVSDRSPVAVVKEGSVANGVWYTFVDGTKMVAAGFTNEIAPVASVNGVNYASLSDAFASCADRPYSEITLLKNLKVSGTDNAALKECVTVPADCSIKLKAGTGNEIVRASSGVDDGAGNSVAYTGSLFFVEDNAVLTLDGITLSGNSANVKGAAPVVMVEGELVLDGSSKIQLADGVNGGAVYLDNGILNIKKGSVDNNTAQKGAGVYMTGSESMILGDGNVMTNEIGNNKYTVSGGGVYMENGIVSGCDISANIPAGTAVEQTMGGGVYAVNGQIVNSTVGAFVASGVSNRADVGAGIYAENLAMKNVTVKNNSADDYAGGLYYKNDLVLSGKISVKDNTAGTAASNIYFDVANGKAFRVDGELDDASDIRLFLSETGAAANGKIVAQNGTARLALCNMAQIALDNSTEKVLTSSESGIAVMDAGQCVKINLKLAQDSDGVTSVPAIGTCINVPLNGEAILFLNQPYGLDVNVISSDDTAVSVEYDYEHAYGAIGESVYIIKALDGAAAGQSYDVTVVASYQYYQRSLHGSDEIDEIEHYMYANNVVAYNSSLVVSFDYAASQMNPYADILDVTYVPFASGDSTVKKQMTEVKEAVTDSFSGYFRIEPRMSQTPADNGAVLGPISEVPYVTISMNVSDFANDGDYVDVVSYNGMVDGNKNVGGMLHKGLLVKDGFVAFDVTRGTGSTPDVVYVALVEHDNDAASIGSKGYSTLAEAFSAAKTGDEIKILRDVTIRSSMVVPEDCAITVSSENGARIIRGDVLDGAMFYVSEDGELTLKNLVIDGGAQITSTSPLTNAGVEAGASIVANHGKLTVTGCDFENGCINGYGSYSDDYCGGALYNAVTGVATVKDANFTSNYADYGGAIYNYGELDLEDCTVSGNTAKLVAGAVYSIGSLQLTDTDVAYNKCSDTGVGGIYNVGELCVAGDVNISSNSSSKSNMSNVDNSGEDPIVINGALTDSARIGITYPSKAGSIIAEGDGTKVKDAKPYCDNFFPDTANLEITDNEDKQIEFGSKTAKYVTVSLSAGANGTVSPVGDIRVVSGEDVKITVTPTGDSSSAYAVADIFVDGESVLSAAAVDAATGIATYTLSDIKADKTVEATFKRAPGSTITPSASAGGTITPSDKIKVNDEDTVTFTITPNEGYYLDTLKLSGKDVLDKAVKNSNGSYTYVASGITDENAALVADFKPIYSVRTLVDEASGVEVKGTMHYQAKLKVESLAECHPSLYNQMKSVLTNNKDFTQYLAQAYEISLYFDNETEMEGWGKLKSGTGAEITFNLGTSYKGKTVRIFHGNGSTIDTTSHMGVIGESGEITISVNSLSPFGIVVQEKVVSSTGTGDGTGNGGNGTGTGNGGNTLPDGKGPVSGDYSEPKTVPPVVIVLLVLSAATVVFVACKLYLPKLKAYVRGRYAAR